MATLACLGPAGTRHAVLHHRSVLAPIGGAGHRSLVQGTHGPGTDCQRDQHDPDHHQRHLTARERVEYPWRRLGLNAENALALAWSFLTLKITFTLFGGLIQLSGPSRNFRSRGRRGAGVGALKHAWQRTSQGTHPTRKSLAGEFSTGK